MVWDKKPAAVDLTKHDWTVLGHELMQNDKPVLPACRLNVPIPATPDGLHSLAHRLSRLSEALHTSAREAALLPSPRLSLGDAMGSIRAVEQDFRRLRKEWERELRERLEVDGKTSGTVEHLRQTGG